MSDGGKDLGESVGGAGGDTGGERAARCRTDRSAEREGAGAAREAPGAQRRPEVPCQARLGRPRPAKVPPGARRLACIVDAAHDGGSVEDVLRGQLGLTHRAVSRAKFLDPGITLDGVRVRVRTRVSAGQRVSAVVGDAPDAADRSRVVPEEGPLAIVYEDDDLVVLDKPAGIATHPGPGHAIGTLGNRIVAHLSAEGLPPVLHAVHRLDLGTTGLVVAAKSATAQHRLTRQMHTQDFERTYLAICLGVPEPACGTIDAPIAQPDPRDQRREVRADGKRAVTHYQVMATGALPTANGDARPVALVRCELETGRTHQIRLHFAHIECPLIGDGTYGRGNATASAANGILTRPALHSWRLALAHPMTGERLALEAPLPDDLRVLLATCGIEWPLAGDAAPRG